MEQNEEFQKALKENKIHEFIKSELEKGNDAVAVMACFYK